MRGLLQALRSAPLTISFAGMLFCAPWVLGAEASEASDSVIRSALGVRPDTIDYDFAKISARAEIAYVSSGSKAFALRMIDNDLRTAFRFPGFDRQPTVIVELAQSEQLHRIKAVFDSKGAKLDVYLLNALPKDPGNVDGLKPTVSVVDFTNRGETSIDFEPTGARYVALRWTRDESDTEPFEAAEISAFALVPREQVFAELPYSEKHFPDETVTDPPVIASISP